MAIDSRLIGIWFVDKQPDSLREIRSDGKEFFFNPSMPFFIDTTFSPELLILNVGSSAEDKRDRISGTPASGIVGVWNDSAHMKPGDNVSEIYYKKNNTYEQVDSLSPLELETGEYATTGGVNAGHIQEKGFTSTISTNGNTIIFRQIWMADEYGTFSFSNGDNTVTFMFEIGPSMIYQRVP